MEPGTTAAAPAETTPAGTAPAESMESGTTTENDAGSALISSPASDLRMTLDRLLAEHADLAILATQKGLTGAEDFEAIAAALDANSVEISQAIGSVYGAEAAKQFLDGPLMWRDHISFFVAYTGGLAGGDKAAQKEAVANLMGYIEAFSSFLSTATGLSQAALRESITDHVIQLKSQIDGYAAADYEAAYTAFRKADAGMYATGDALAGAIFGQQQ